MKIWLSRTHYYCFCSMRQRKQYAIMLQQRLIFNQIIGNLQVRINGECLMRILNYPDGYTTIKLIIHADFALFTCLISHLVIDILFDFLTFPHLYLSCTFAKNIKDQGWRSHIKQTFLLLLLSDLIAKSKTSNLPIDRQNKPGPFPRCAYSGRR